MMDEEEHDVHRVVRVKELEDMVRKLERENKQLLNKVKTTGPNTTGRKKEALRAARRTEDDLESDLLSLSDADQDDEDSWLFVSPKCPPTPKQLQLTPVKWFSEGHRGGNKALDLPSLDDVRKSLTFHINEMEHTATVPNSPLATKSARHKKMNQNARNEDLNQHVQRAQLEDNAKNGHKEIIPKVKWTAPSQDQGSTKPEDDIPKVKWNSQASSHDDNEQVRWNASSSAHVMENGEDIPKVSWRAAGSHNAATEDVPKIKWDPKAVANLDEYSENENEVKEDQVPIVKWRTPPSGSEDTVPGAKDTVPVVKWKKPVQVHTARENTSDVPVIKWKANQPPSSTTQEEEVPVIKRRATQPAQSPPRKGPQRQGGRIPSTSPNRRLEASFERRSSEESRGNGEMERGGASEQPTQQRVSRLTAYQSGLQRPHQTSGTSPLRYRNTSPQTIPKPPRDVSPLQYRNTSPQSIPKPPRDVSPLQYRNTSPQSIPKRPRDVSPGQRQQPTLRSLSPSSPSLRLRSRSPSPSAGTFNDRQILPQKVRRSPSPSRRSLVQPASIQKLSSPSSSPRVSRTPPSSSQEPSALSRHQSGLPHPPKLQTENIRTPPSAARSLTKRGLTPPSGRSLQHPGGGSTGNTPGGSFTPPTGRGQATPPTGRGEPKRVLPTPPGQQTQQGLRTPNKASQQRRSLQRPQQQATPPRQPGAHDDDDWLEGCF